jgi:hypothetical protein
MDARITRIKKEVRALFWPWCAVVLAGALPAILLNSYSKKMNLLSFFVGVPLLAALSLGNEFQHRTLTLWLTQPFSRMQLWGEKMSVMFAAVLSAALFSGMVLFSLTWPDLHPTYQAAAIICVLVTTASAPFGILVARSTLGGFGLVGCFLFLIVLVITVMAKARLGEEWPPSLPVTPITAFAAIGIGYAGLMLWLGARKLARFQVTGGSADDDLLMADSALVPEALAERLRCQPSGAFPNLIRKELRLLQPFWLFTLLAHLYLASAAVFRLLPAFPIPPRHPAPTVEFTVFVTLGAFFLLAPIFAGILSLGEERRSGTQAWHMTLPVSPLRQWLLKLVTAMVAGFASSVLLPLLVVVAVGSVLGSPFLFVDFRELRDWMLMVPIMTFAAFWCACAANGTVRASLWVATAPMAVFVASSGGTWLGRDLAGTTGTLKDLVVSWFHLSPLAFASITDFARAGVLWLFVPTLILALIQSYRLFRMQPQDSVLWMLRCLLPLIMVTVLWSFSVSAGFVSSRWEPFSETRQALDKLQPGTAKLELAGEDLAKGSPLTALTRRWLRGSSILVAPDKAHSSGYLATIHLASGLECRLTVTRYGGTAASCAQKGR